MQGEVVKFIRRYKELRELIYSISETLESYLIEMKSKCSLFDEFLGSYTLKVSAVVWNQYDEEKIGVLLDDMEKQIKGDKTFKGIPQFMKIIRSELKNLEKLYYQGDVEESELEDLEYNLKSPFEDIEERFEENEWDYDNYK